MDICKGGTERDEGIDDDRGNRRQVFVAPPRQVRSRIGADDETGINLPPAKQVNHRGLARVVVRCAARKISAVRESGEVGERLVGTVDVPVSPHRRQSELRVPVEFSDELDCTAHVLVPAGGLGQTYPGEERTELSILAEIGEPYQPLPGDARDRLGEDIRMAADDRAQMRRQRNPRQVLSGGIRRQSLRYRSS